MSQLSTNPPPRITVSPSQLLHRHSALASLNGIGKSILEEPAEEPAPPPEPFLLPHERDVLVLSTVAKLLLFPS